MSNLPEVRRAEMYLEAFEEGRLTDDLDLLEALNLKWFRINTLYFIKNKEGKKVPFKPNAAQRERYIHGHVRDIILKARQLGFTTEEMIEALDDCLFTDNFSAGCIAHKLDDAQDIFRNKVQFAYENLSPSWVGIMKELGVKVPGTESDSTGGYVFTNGSSIRVNTSYRGGTLQRLHVSEFGKICRQFPDKAKEIVTGAFEAVGLGNKITLESTAEGQEGYFYDYCKDAENLALQGKDPGVMDFKFHFFPWWAEPSYRLEGEEVHVSDRLKEYFEKLAVTEGIVTTRAQQAWYAKKEQVLQDDMKREYPSTPREAFEQSIEGAYYARQMTAMRQEGRLTTKVAHNPALPVYTAWDLGMNDAMAIWFVQIVGREVHVIDYFEDSGEGFEYYAEKLREMEVEKGYHFVTHGHFGPHDLAVRELGSGKRLDTARSMGISFADPVPAVANQMEGVNAVRQFLPMCWINEDNCAEGVKCLDNYRKEWDQRLGRYKDQPRHDWASHGAKAFETMARSGILQIVATGSDFQGRRPAKKRAGWSAHT